MRAAGRTLAMRWMSWRIFAHAENLSSLPGVARTLCALRPFPPSACHRRSRLSCYALRLLFRRWAFTGTVAGARPVSVREPGQMPVSRRVQLKPPWRPRHAPPPGWARRSAATRAPADPTHADATLETRAPTRRGRCLSMSVLAVLRLRWRGIRWSGGVTGLDPIPSHRRRAAPPPARGGLQVSAAESA